MAVILSHIGLEPIIYGIIIALGILNFWVKYLLRAWVSLISEILTFWFVFTLHGGTMTGGMAAATAALLVGWIVPILLYITRIVRNWRFG